ncbi:hypothetical protein Dda_7167 [Drechslerella dactyloides]|uniref:Uncharacterized protein n=1 Tax=Drechslerella dactyloides TaxID=74499 RepID=A0AAD6NIT1_DREDA|nr:hypothetical protein Dda_7167 [Drechslerella dactyloides]
MAGVPVPITAAPTYQPPYGGRIPFGDGLEKRQQLTFGTCGLECATDYFCQGYRSSYGFCCPSSVLTRTEFNYCGPATSCVNYGVSSVTDFFYDSSRSIQYCGQNRPNCATFIFTNDDFTQVFCAAGTTSGLRIFDTTSTPGQSATFLPGPGSSATAQTDSGSSPRPTATVVSRTTSGGPSSTGGPAGTSSAATTSAAAASNGLGTGAVAGIAVGAALGGIGLAVAAFFFWRRSSKKTRGGSSGGHGQFAPQPPVAEQYGHYQHQQPYAPVSQGHGAELSGDSDFYKPVSAHGGQRPPVFELGGTGGGGGQFAPPYQENASAYQENSIPWNGQRRQELQG